MRANLKGRLTTTYRRASQRVKFGITESYWLALVADPETFLWKQHGIIHRQIGKDGRNHMVWPDQSVHQFEPSYVAFYTFFAKDMEHAQQIAGAMLEKMNTKENVWQPSAGTQRGVLKPTLRFPLEASMQAARRNVNTLEIRE